MGKTSLRAITASEDMASLIDQGAEVDTEIKNLSFRDKALKGKITEGISPSMEEGEKSLVVNGNKASATITTSEKCILDASKEGFELVKTAAEVDIFGDALTVKREVQIPGDDLDKAVGILIAAGINASLKTEVSVSAPEFRKLEPNGEQGHDQVLDVLRRCVETEVTFRVKYGKKVEIE